MMLGISVIPLLIIGSIGIYSLLSVSGTIDTKVNEIGNESITTSTGALQKLAEENAIQNTQSIAKELEVYLADHPDKT